MSYDHWKTSPPEELCAHCGMPFRADNCTLHAESDAGNICDDCAEAIAACAVFRAPPTNGEPRGDDGRRWDGDAGVSHCADHAPAPLDGGILDLAQALPPRDIELAIREVRECLERQLPQGLDNAARTIVACLDEFGRR